MVVLINILTAVVLVAAVVGLIYPQWVVFWKKEGASMQDVFRWYFPSFILLAFVASYVNNI